MSTPRSDTYGPLQTEADEIGVLGGSVREESVRQYFEVFEIPYRLVGLWRREWAQLLIYECDSQDGHRWAVEFNLQPDKTGEWVVWFYDEKPDREAIQQTFRLERKYGEQFLDRGFQTDES